MPASRIRVASQSGVGAAGSKPVTVRATNTGQPTAVVDAHRVAVGVGGRHAGERTGR